MRLARHTSYVPKQLARLHELVCKVVSAEHEAQHGPRGGDRHQQPHPEAPPRRILEPTVVRDKVDADKGRRQADKIEQLRSARDDVHQAQVGQPERGQA